MTEPAALVFEERRFSLPELDALADGWAAALAKDGVTAGQRVAVMASNRPEFLAVVLAIWRLAAGAVLISPAWKRDEVDHALALTDPGHAVGDHPVLAGLMPMLHLDEPVPPAEPVAGSAPLPGTDAALVFSSGTTGLPKAVRHTHTALDEAVRQWRHALQLTRSDRIQVATPPSHILGLLNLLTALKRGPVCDCIAASTSTGCCTTSKVTASQWKWRSLRSRWPSPPIRASSPMTCRRCATSCGAPHRSTSTSRRR